MQQNFTHYFQRHAVWLALLLHLLLVTVFSTTFLSFTKTEDPPADYIPAYAFTNPVVNNAHNPTKNNQKNDIDKAGIEKKESMQAINTETSQQQSETNVKQDEEPIHLIGDKNKTPKPLIKLLGRALTAHMKYPKIAADFQLKGTAIIGFTLSPNGEVSNIHILKTSGTKVLDDAALAGLNAVSPLKGTEQYLTAPEELAIGFMFR